MNAGTSRPQDTWLMRDLQYPEDAERVIDAMLAGLRYDAAVAAFGIAAAKTDLGDSDPDFSVGIRYGGRAEDEAVRRDAPGLLSRFSLVSMVSRVDRHAQQLLQQRRVLEHLLEPATRMTPAAMWRILRRVASESRRGIVTLCSELVVEAPSAPLMERMEWLEGLVRVRNCLAHRLGRVQVEDVRPPGSSLEETKDTDVLKVSWLRARAFLDDREVESFPHAGGGQLNIRFEEDEREWRIGDQVEVTPLDCQAIALSLALLGNQLLADFQREMDRTLGLSRGSEPDRS
jgi:hypothetical protein